MSDIIFQKSLEDMIKGIRSHKGSESSISTFISGEMTAIKTELKSADPFIKAEAIRKLTYLQMIGYNISWAAFSIIEVMSFSRFAHKQIGYLAANQSFNEATDLILLTTNLFKKEFSNSSAVSQYEVGLALNSLSNIVTPELGRDCLSDLVGLINNSQPYLRKKAVLALYKLYIKYPAGLRLTFDLLKDRLDDSDSSVVSTAVSVICELANRNPRNYLALAPKFFQLLTTSSNNWLLIKLVKLFALLVSEEPRLARKLIDPLVTIIMNNSAKSLQFECIHALTAAYLYTKKEDGTEAKNVVNAVKICSDHLRLFIEDTDQNLKYLGLVGLIDLMKSHPRVVVDHRDMVLRCLSDEDLTIRTKALELLAGIVSKRSLVEIVKHLMQHVSVSEGAYRDQIINTILSIAGRERYSMVDDFAWYVSVLLVLGELKGVDVEQNEAVGAQLIDISLRVEGVRPYMVHSLLPILVDKELVRSNKLDSVQHLLSSAGWAVGEYSAFLGNISGDKSSDEDDDDGCYWMDGPSGEEKPSVFRGRELHREALEALLGPRAGLLSIAIQAQFVHAAMKVFIRAVQDCEESQVSRLIAILRIRLPVYMLSPDAEVSERASSFRHLLASLLILPLNWTVDESKNGQNKDDRSNLLEFKYEESDVEILSVDRVGAARAKAVKHLLAAAVEESFYVVSSKAQRRVPTPAEINLSVPIDSKSFTAFMKVEDDLANSSISLTPISMTLFGSAGISNRQIEHQNAEVKEKEDSARGLYTIPSKPSPFFPTSNNATNALKKSGEEQLFYLRPRENPVPEVTPLSRVLLDSFEDPLAVPRKRTSKKTKVSSSRRKNADVSRVNTSEMQPAGAVSSDEDAVDRKRRGGPSRKGKLASDFYGEDLDSIDITTPLRPDEVLPVHKHRETPAQVAPASLERGVGEALEQKKDKKPKKEKKLPKKVKNSSDKIDLLSFSATEKPGGPTDDLLGLSWAQPETQYASPSGGLLLGNQNSVPVSAKMWLPLASHEFIDIFYSISGSVKSGNVQASIALRLTSAASAPARTSCTMQVSEAGNLQPSSPVSVATNMQPASEERSTMTIDLHRDEDSLSSRQLNFTFKLSFDRIIAGESVFSLRASATVYPCAYFSPLALDESEFVKAWNKPSSRWGSAELKLTYSGKRKTALKAIGYLLNSHVIEATDSVKSIFLSSKMPEKGALYCILTDSDLKALDVSVRSLRSSQTFAQRTASEAKEALLTLIL